MSKKFSTTTSDFLDWNEMTNLVRKLEIDKDYKMSLLVSIGCFFGLRISDLLSLRWEQILNVDEFTITEKKTQKKRTIRINPQLKNHISNCYIQIKPNSIESNILISQKKSVFSNQQINNLLKLMKEKYKLNIKNISSHTLRKTFARQVYNQNSDNAELALVKLMELLNHSSMAIAKRYIGLRQEELLSTYDLLSF
jgi:integrase